MWSLYEEARKFAKGNEHLAHPYISDVVAPKKPDKCGRTIGVAAVARPEPDLRRFVRTLIQMSEDEIRKEFESRKAA